LSALFGKGYGVLDASVESAELLIAEFGPNKIPTTP
jgi:hypothetical protein